MTSPGSDVPEPEGTAIDSWLLGSGCSPRSDSGSGHRPDPALGSTSGSGSGCDDGERPHVVVTLDTRTGDASISGPYRTALGALCAADAEYQVDRDQGGHGELTFHVAALHAPIGSDDLEPVLDVGLPRPSDEHDLGWLAHAIAGLTAGAERAIRRRARLAAGSLAVTAAPWLPDVGDAWSRRGRGPRPRLHGREAR